MAVEILTRQDLLLFKQELIIELKRIFRREEVTQKKWIKSHDVRRILKISPGTLQNLRIKGTLQYTKIGGTLFYDYDQILSLLNGVKK